MLFRAPQDARVPAIARWSPLSAPLAQIHRRLKAEFDPAGIFNRGRMYPDL